MSIGVELKNHIHSIRLLYFGVEKMSKEQQKPKVINVKLEPETKKKFDALANLLECNIQDLCLTLIKNAIDKNADAIAKYEDLQKETNIKL